MAMAMASGVSPISEISHAKENWNILAKIVRLWLVRDFTKHKMPFSIEIVLMDEHGKRIHASMRRTLVYKFEKLLKEGSVYSIQFLSVAANVGAYKTCRHSHKLIFQISTKVQILDTGRVVGHEYELVPIPQITAAGFDSDFLVDVIGVITGAGSERQYERNGTKTKLNVISLEAAGHKIECTLFGEYVDELNTFLASGEIDNVVVIIQYAKVKTFQEKVHLQNCMSCTKLIFNPIYEAAVEVKKSLIASMESLSQGLSQLKETAKISLEEEFLELTPRNTILGLNSQKEPATFVVFGTVKDIISGSRWW